MWRPQVRSFAEMKRMPKLGQTVFAYNPRDFDRGKYTVLQGKVTAVSEREDLSWNEKSVTLDVSRYSMNDLVVSATLVFPKDPGTPASESRIREAVFRLIEGVDLDVVLDDLLR